MHERADELREIGAGIICPPAEMVERLRGYAEPGIDELILSPSFGQPVEETVEMMERFAAEVMPHLRGESP